MFRKFIALTVAAFFFSSGLIGAEIKGKLLKVDAEKNTITVVVGAKKGEKGEEKTFTIAKDAKFCTLKPGKKGEKPTEESITDGLKNDAFKASDKGGPNVTLVTEGEGTKEVVKEVKIAAGRKKKGT